VRVSTKSLSVNIAMSMAICISGSAVHAQYPVAEEESKGRLKEIDQLIRAGRAPSVVVELEQMVKRDPNNPLAWSTLSRAYLDADFSSNPLAKAVAASERAVQLRPKNSRFLKYLAELYARKGEFKKALSLLDKAMSGRRIDPFCYKTRALIYSEMKRDKEALADWEMFLKLHPTASNHTPNLEEGAMIYARGGQADKAIAIYDKLASQAPGGAAMWQLKKAECLAQAGKPKLAIDVLTKHLVKEKDDEVALMQRAKYYRKLGMNSEALKDVSFAIKCMPTTSMYKERASLYEAMGNAALAKKDRETANSLD